MMNFLRKHKIKIFIITILGFLAGTFVGFGSYIFGDKNSFDTVAIVNGKKIPYKLYYSLYNNAINTIKRSNQELTPEISKDIQRDIISSLIKDELVASQADKYGIIVSDKELARDIQSYPYFLNDNNQFDSRYYFQFLSNMRLSPKEFESFRRTQLLSNKLQHFIAMTTTKMNSAQEQYYKKQNRKLSQEVIAQQVKPSEILNDWFDEVKKEVDFKVTSKDF